MSSMIAVDANAIVQLVNALNGPEHHIREIMATRSIASLLGSENPIDVLCKNIKDAVTTKTSPGKTTTYTKSEMEAMALYAQAKGGITTTDSDPEEGIRYIVGLVDRIREERAVLAIRNR